MAYVSVPKDLTKVKNKVAFNLTKRQLICIGIGAAMGIPCYFLFRNALGINNAAVLMVLMMLPAFLFAMYEKDGMHLEDVLMHVIRVKFIRPSVRKYETENYYESDLDGEDQKTMRKEERKGGKSGGKKKKKGSKEKDERKEGCKETYRSTDHCLQRNGKGWYLQGAGKCLFQMYPVLRYQLSVSTE